ncbi:unnamed protein product [Tuber melanosporum]|uniref:(Perigord truffle) hypothetical protein n=1 Tax=Tuber melanosporum (strain Mel28) TaxID=656061 RepID=D5GD79_TUBMM|nr:uncharacterized protein GSTUM_00006083001 [Tuber melanosporum]CAZ82472.1 unnamed protein product [Tuber melanosporum]
MDDYRTLRAKTLGSTQEGEAVTVNTRALPCFVTNAAFLLYRLRELLQNAADANANSVEVRFQSDGSASVPPGHQPDFRELVKSKMQRILVKNDGHSFRDEDWLRLKRIAEGNPDETKIGAFGVGFYSVFADCEEPFVSSGDQAMAFYWKGNSLFTRRVKLDTRDRYTTFLLEYREPSELPDLKDLCKFFATSLTFVRLNSISLYVDDHCLLSLQKKTSPSDILQIPESIDPTTRDKLMRIARVDMESVQIDAKYMNVTHYSPPAAEISQTLRSMFSRLTSQPVAPKESFQSDLSAYTTVSIFLRIATATVNTNVTPSFAKELERATKKPPPKTTKLAILSMSKDELDASEDAEIFSNVLPGKSGRIFIGFPTHQTTSISAHISAPSVIPTVERENIDLNARVIRDWNVEMLRIAGILARIMYTDEMSVLARRAERQKGQLEDLFDHAIHIMKQFTFTPSTPASAVGDRIGMEFWSCSKRSNSIEIMSTRGVLSSDQVRLSSDVNFLVGLPLLPEKIAKEAHEFIRGLRDRGLLTEITATDIQQELQSRALSGAQQDLFLKWLAEKRTKGDLDDNIVQNLLSVAVATTSSPEGSNGDVTIPISLGMIKYYVNPNKLSPDVPIPSDCLPFQVTKALSMPQLMALGWEEIAVLTWLRFICSPPHPLPVSQSIELSPKFSAQVLAIVSKNWDQMTSTQKENAVGILRDKRCIPTKMGLRIPTEAYFNTVKLFQDLPLIVSMNGVRDKFLTALGVRKTVELKLVFERLMNEDATQRGTKWSHLELVRYLTSVWNDIPKDDIAKLKNTAICTAETSSPRSQQNRYKVSQLYEPDDQLRKLGLPILYWPNWKGGSPEGKFLTSLGLKKYPSAQDVLRIAAVSADNETLREAALQYYVSNYYHNGYTAFNAAGMEMAFLPLKGKSQEKARLAAPRHCYSNPRAAIMGYDILRSDLQEHGQKFGVSADPPMALCVDKLILQPPTTIGDAQEKFSYFSTRLAEILPHLVERLSNARIVPVPLKPGDMRPGPARKLKWIPPKNCFLGGQGSLYYEIFDFVNLGQDANAFLTKCGSKHEPTVAEVAYMIVREPDRLLDVFGGEKKYMGALRSIAENWSHLKKDRMLLKEMRKSRFLGALREVSAGNGADASAAEENADGGTIKEFTLARADQVLVIDEYVTYVMFKSEILTAPQEDILESFYTALGASAVSARVFPEWRIGNPIHAEREVEKLSKLVLERCRLFLHNNNEEVAHDARWLENNLRVSYVDTIRVKNTLRHEGYKTISHLQGKTASITKDTVTKQIILYVTRGFLYYDVSVGLVSIILRRPKPHSYLLLESLLSTDLMVLKSRGFNVERILKAKAAEARIAENQRLRRLDEERRKFEEEEKLAREKEKLQQKQILPEQTKQATREPEERFAMPGAFTEPVPPIVDRPRTNNFFGKITKTLGLDKDSQQTEQIKDFLDYQSPEQHHQAQLQIKPTSHAQPQVEKPTEPHRIRENLRRAVESSRSHDSNDLFNLPETLVVKEQKSYCDSRPSHDITFAGYSALGIKLYVDRKAKEQDIFGKNAAAVNSFSKLLKEISEIYSLRIASMHIYFDEQGTSIAFNTSGSIFCNLRFFLELHGEAVAKGDTEKALAYWFVVVAHELAHNLVPEHSAQHSFYAETFTQEYFIRAMAAIQKGREAKTQ